MRAMQLVGVVAATGLVVSCIENTIPTPNVEDQLFFNPAEPPATHQQDSYEQIQKPEVDILWIVDNSCSMAEEQEELGENFPIFMEFFLGSNLDYHIGVVSTDMDNPDESGKLIQAASVRWITPETPNPDEVFAAMSLLGTSGSGDEQGILASYAAIELQTTWNEGFFRDNAAIHMIVVSDESDYSPNDPVTLNEFAGYLNGLRTDQDAVAYHSIVAPPQNELPCGRVSTTGARYIDVTEQVGGVYWSLCEENWGGALEAIGLETAGLKREYFMSERPVNGTVKVTVEENGYTSLFKEYDPVTLLGDWTYSEPRNSVTFIQYVPNPGAVVHIDYEILSASERQE